MAGRRRQSTTVRINILPVTIFSFASAVFYLAATYLGDPFPYIFSVCLVLAALNLTYSMWAVRAFSMVATQKVGTHIRGESATLSARLMNDMPIPSVGWTVHRTLSVPVLGGGALQTGEEVSVAIRASSGIIVENTAGCMHRGVHALRIGPVAFSDPLGWFSVSKSGVQNVFDVLPRVPDIDPKRVLSAGHVAEATAGRGRSSAVDPSMLRGLSRYRDGMPIKHIAWKKTAASGIAYVKEYDSSFHSGVSVFLDTRRAWGNTETILSTEDASVELFVGIVRSLLGEQISVRATTLGTDRRRFSGQSLGTFDRFYQSTRHITFTHERAPHSATTAQLQAETTADSQVLVISHTPDPLLRALPQKNRTEGPAYTLIANATAWSWEQRERIELSQRAYSGSRYGGGIIVLRSASELEGVFRL